MPQKIPALTVQVDSVRGTAIEVDVFVVVDEVPSVGFEVVVLEVIFDVDISVIVDEDFEVDL